MKSQFPSFALTFVAVMGFFGLFVSEAGAQGNPEFRPALIGNESNSLVNLVDTEKLLQSGQGDAVVMFDELVFPFTVKGAYGSVYRGTAGSKLLQKAVLRALDKAQFIPAIAHYKKTAVDFRGTVMFFATGKPHLRVFANQDARELARFADFITPQLIGGSTKWDPNDPQLETARRLNKNAAVVLSLQVNERGELLSSRVISEDPPGFNFGAAVLKSFKTARFIPGFRNGKLVDCTFETTEYVSVHGRYRGEVSFQ